MDAPKPLGYWLQHLHNLLETQFAMVLSDFRVDRRQWQLLNTLAQHPRGRDDLAAALAPFWNADEPDPERGLAELTARGWVTDANGVIGLTEPGRRAHADLSQRVNETRAVVLTGLTPDRYAETVRTLSIMAQNVETAIGSRTTR
jgi:DNA-binding MarR family transcriptional regulator